MALVKIGTGQARRDIREQRPGLGGRTVGTAVADVEVWVDVDLLVRLLGSKAMGNKKGRSSLQSGAIVLRALNVRKLETASG